MAQATPTPRQAEIKRLLDADQSVGDIAKYLNTTAQAVYNQISAMRKKGILPKKRGGKGRARTAQRTPRIAPEPVAAEAPSPNGSANGDLISLEAHLSADLNAVRTRLEAIAAEQKKLGEEGEGLESRRTRLEAAEKALAPA